MEVTRILYRSVDEQVMDLLDYVGDLEKQRDEALEKVRDWNKDTEIQEAEEKKKVAYAQLAKGFAPDDEQWAQIHEWEKTHSKKYHKPPKIDHPVKVTPNAPFFEYSFEYTAVGTLGCVTCKTCYWKAMKKSRGNTRSLSDLCDENDVRFFFGEV